MKRILIVALYCLIGISCQTEELVINNAPQDNLVGNTILLGKLARLVQYPTAIDNVADNTSCFALQLPFSAVVNAQTVIVDSAAGYQAIREILAEDDSNTDNVTIQFPVTITFRDYTQTTITNQAAFNSAIANCTSSIELSCIDLLYPLQVQTYNSQNQIADTFALNSEQALYQFVTTLAQYDAVTLNYPVTLTTPEGTAIAIASNSELEAAIDSYTDECLAALNPGTGPGPGTNPTFAQTITSGTWYVSYFFRDEESTGEYGGFDFTFNSNGSITVMGDGGSSGSWNTTLDGSELEFDLTFSDSDLEELGEDWTVTEWTATEVKLQKVSGGGDDIRSLYFKKN